MKTERMTPAQLPLNLSIQDRRSAKLFTPHALTDLSHFVNVRFIKGSSSTLVRRQYGGNCDIAVSPGVSGKRQ
jgi:hypothetical protein